MSKYINNMPKVSEWNVENSDILVECSTHIEQIEITTTEGKVTIDARYMHQLISVLEDAIGIIDEDIKQNEADNE